MIKNKLDTLHFISKAGICKRNSLNKEWLGYMTIITYYFMEFGYCGLGFFLWRLKALSWHRWYTSPMRTWVIREIHDKQIKSWFAFLVLKSTLPEATGKFKRLYLSGSMVILFFKQEESIWKIVTTLWLHCQADSWILLKLTQLDKRLNGFGAYKSSCYFPWSDFNYLFW